MNTRTITLVGMFAAVMCVLSPITIPMTPVPITLATLAVYIIGSLFDYKRAPLIVIIYILLGAIGMPVFSNGNGGAAVLLGPTGGYIFGYIICAVVQSILVTIFKSKKWMHPVAMVAGTILLYIFGTAWFLFYMNVNKGIDYSLAKALMVCVVPFLLGDSIKIVVSTLIGVRFRPMMDKAIAKKN